MGWKQVHGEGVVGIEIARPGLVGWACMTVWMWVLLR